jgi:hypothetical protein
MTPTESTFYRALPSIGHANAGSVPDECGIRIDLYAKRSEKGEFESLIKRDNTVYFADCSRRILDMLCAANKKPPFTDRQWNALQTKLAEAQNSNTWGQTFPDIHYDYKKDEFLNIKMEILRNDAGILNRLKIKATDLPDIYSEESDRGRLSAIALARQVNDDFYHYNEAAYRHVFAATGEYTTRSHRTQLSAYCNMAEAEAL